MIAFKRLALPLAIGLISLASTTFGSITSLEALLEVEKAIDEAAHEEVEEPASFATLTDIIRNIADEEVYKKVMLMIESGNYDDAEIALIGFLQQYAPMNMDEDKKEEAMVTVHEGFVSLKVQDVAYAMEESDEPEMPKEFIPEADMLLSALERIPDLEVKEMIKTNIANGNYDEAESEMVKYVEDYVSEHPEMQAVGLEQWEEMIHEGMNAIKGYNEAHGETVTAGGVQKAEDVVHQGIEEIKAEGGAAHAKEDNLNSLEHTLEEIEENRVQLEKLLEELGGK